MRNLLLIIGVSFLCVHCSNDMKEVNKLFGEEELHIDKMEGIETIYSDSAVVQIVISGEEVWYYTDKNELRQEYRKGIHVDFLRNDKKVGSWLKADYGVKNEKESTAYLKGNVIFKNKKGDELLTKELFWNEKYGELYTDKFVRIVLKESNDTLAGYGMKTNEDFSRFEIKRRFFGKITMDKIQNESLLN